MKRLFAAAAFAPLLFAAHHAQAQTSVSTATTAPLVTSTAGNIEITSTGSVQVQNGNPAITVDSDNTVKADGVISVRDSANGTGVLVVTPTGGLTSTITINNAIVADDSTGGVDDDKDGDLDGDFVPSGVVRYGIRVTGDGVFTGDITHTTNTIAVKGNEGSAGVQIESPVAGKVTLNGTIGVLGSDSYGARLMGAIDGPVTIGGVVNAQGLNATGVSIEGPVSGLVRFHGTVNSTGFRYTDNSASPDPAKFDADDLLIGKSAVVISSSLAHGLVFDAPPSENDPTDFDEDDDGILDDDEGTATIRAYGSAPAVLIGGAADLKIGKVGEGVFGGYGLQINGQVLGLGINKGVSGAGMRLGGLGGNVEVEGGIRIAGELKGEAFDADATGLLFAAGASTPVLVVDTGLVSAGSNSTASGFSPLVRAVVIEPGASVPELFNNGTIRAGANAASANAYAVSDKSGSLTKVTNIGIISATIATGDVDIDPAGDRIALDLRNSAAGVSLIQGANGNENFVPFISGDILLAAGASNDNIAIFAGRTTGAMVLGGGDDNILFGGTSRTNLQKTAGGLNIGVAGDLTLTNTNRVDASSLLVGPQGLVTFTADPQNSDPTQQVTFLNVAGDTTFESGSKVDLEFISKLNGPAALEVLRTGSLINNGVDVSLVSDLPYIFTGQARVAGKSIFVDVRPRTAGELGMAGGRAAAYDAFYAAFDKDPGVARSVFGKTNEEDFAKLFDQFLPDYSGGPFTGLANGARAVQQAQAEEAKDMVPGEPRSWLQEVGIGTKFESVNDIEYETAGIGLAGGLEKPIGATNQVYGFSGAFISTEIRNSNRSLGSLLTGSAVVSSVYWRAQERGMILDASFSGAYSWFDSDRRVVDQARDGTQNLIRTASADWSGAMAAARMGVAYNWEAGPFYVRHDAVLDAVYLREGAYTEMGGGPGVNLSVDKRENYEAAAEVGLLMGAHFGRGFRWGPEIRVAYRGVLDGGEGETVGHFASVPGAGFILPGLVKDRQRITIRAALRGSGAYANFALEASGDIGEVYQAYMARIIVRFLF